MMDSFLQSHQKKISLFLLALTGLSLVLTLWVFFTGGGRFSFLGLKISLTGWGRPFVLALLLVGIRQLLLHPEWLKKNGKKILFTSVLMGLTLAFLGVVGEIFARYYIPPDPYQPVFQMHSHPWIQFSLVPEIETKIRIDNGSFVHFKTNSTGYRGPEIPEKSDKFRVLCLGDSFLMGKDVDQKDTLTAQAQKKNDQLEWINAGCGGWNTTQEYYDFKERGQHLDPDGVVLFYVFNDAHSRKKMGSWKRLKESIVMHSALYKFLLRCWIRWEAKLQKQVQISQDPKNSKKEEGEAKNIALSQAKMMNWNEHYHKSRKGWRESQKSLTKIKRLCEERKIPFLVVLFPYLVQLDEHYPFHPVHQAIEKFCEQENVPFLDLFPYYKGKDALKLWVGSKDSHPNQEGQKIAADAVYQELTKQKWFQEK